MKYFFFLMIFLINRNCNSQVSNPYLIINPTDIDSLLTIYDIGFCDFMLDSKINSTISYSKASEGVKYFGGKYDQIKYYNKDSSLLKIKFISKNGKNDSSTHDLQFYFRSADEYRIGQPHYAQGDSTDESVMGFPFFLSLHFWSTHSINKVRPFNLFGI